MKSFMAKAQDIQRKWYVVDAQGKPLGRLASEVAKILRGKNKPTFTPHVDTGDYVIILNSDKIALTGNKMEDKMYRHHSQYIGGMKEIPYKDFLKKSSDKAIRLAVRGMLPKNSLGRSMIRKLKVYKGNEHENEAQMPEILDLKF